MQEIHAEPSTTDTGQSWSADARDEMLTGTDMPTAMAAAEHIPPAPADDAPAFTTTTEQAGPTAAEPPSRTLKLVLTLRPDEGAGYRALLALGTEGCDPLFRSCAVPDLPAAFDQAVALATEAEAHWQHQPRNPGPTASRVKPAPPRRPSGDPGIAATTTDTATSPASSETQPAGTSRAGEPDITPAPAPKATGQLSLFG